MTIDIIFAMLMVYGIFKGYSRGLIVAIFSLVAFVIGLLVALKFAALLSLHLQRRMQWHSHWLPVLSFAILFVGTVLLVRLGARALQGVAQWVALGWLNRLGGILLYLLIYTLALSVLLWWGNQLYLLTPEMKQGSKVYPYIAPLGPRVVNGVGHIVPYFKHVFEDLQQFFDNVATHLQSE